ncbi:tetratricopeptide repeat protein [Candidatus Poribacteria bacterium]|nr:tetratricopeptide repeat protein [Candidatus Poribacteria bacterium]
MTRMSCFLRVPRVILVSLAVMTALVVGGCQKKSPDERFKEATDLIGEKQTARGIIKLKELIRDTPDDPVSGDSHLLLAQYYTREGNAPKALEELEAAYKNKNYGEQRNQAALSGIIEVRRQLKDFETLLKLLDEAIAAIPEGNEGLRMSRQLQKAGVYLQMGGDENIKTGTDLLHTMMLEGKDETMRGQAREVLSQYHRTQSDFEGSNKVYEEYLAAFPDDRVKNHLELAMAVNLRAMGKEDEARAKFEPTAAGMLKAADEELDLAARSQMVLDLAQYHRMMGNLDEAEALMRRVMGENVRTNLAITTQFDIATMYLEAGQTEKGVGFLEQIKRENPGTNIEASADNILKQVAAAKEAAQQAPETLEDTPAAAAAGT